MLTALSADTKRTTDILRNRCVLLALWVLLYASFTLMTPPLLDDADSVHAEVAREMIVRNDWVTLYANGVRYLEKAPLLYWSMAASFKVFGANTGAARVPLALTVLLLAATMESFARRAFGSAQAGLTAGLITLSSFGIFIFTRLTIPDALVCLWITLAIFCYWLNLQRSAPSPLLCWGFAVCCALNVLTKGLIGLVFPVGIVAVHLLFADGWRGMVASLRQLYPVSSAAIFLLTAAPWHGMAAEANPTEGASRWACMGAWALERAVANRGQRAWLDLVLLHERTRAALPEFAGTARLRHGSAVALLRPGTRMADAVERVSAERPACCAVGGPRCVVDRLMMRRVRVCCWASGRLW